MTSSRLPGHSSEAPGASIHTNKMNHTMDTDGPSPKIAAPANSAANTTWTSDVTHIRARRGLLDIRLRELWFYRDLLGFLVWRDIKVRYAQTLMGIGWAVLQPVMTMIVFTVFFGQLADIPSEGIPRPVFYYAALLPWNYFATSLQTATNAVVDNKHMLSKVYFPKLLLPMAAVVTGLVDLAIASGVLVALMIYYGVVPTAGLLLLPVLLALVSLTALGAGTWLAGLSALYRDIRFVVPFGIQLALFCSPVVYPSSMVAPQWQWLYRLNPMAVSIEGFRWAITGQGTAPDAMLGVAFVSATMLMLSGLVYFQKVEGTLVDTV